jgi:hypothetical protein
MDRNGRLCGLFTVACALVCGALAGPAWASNQFTLDGHSDSYGAIVTDATGNAYVTWNHAASPSDVPMFCKLAPGAKHCTYRSSLSLPGDPNYAAAIQPFPILGPNGTVWVVASRYIDNDTVIWTSTNGGKSFGAPHNIPYDTTPPCPAPCTESYSYTNLTNVDDVVPVNFTNYSAYDQGQSAGTGTDGSTGGPAVWWLESSTNPGLGFNFDITDEVLGGPPGVSEFVFENPGSGGVAGSTLGVSSFGSTAAGAPSDIVEAYWLLSTPPTLAYYVWGYNSPTRIPPSPQAGWSGPHVLGAGYVPRLAEGKSGLFLLSADSLQGGQPTVVQIRKYDLTTHSFAAPQTLTTTPSTAAYLFAGGGLGENLETGELAAVWPQLETRLLRLYLSGDGGRHFSPAQYIATLNGYIPEDNARVAIANNGTGFVTFQDDSGLQVADLYPTDAQYRTLTSKKHHGTNTVSVPVTCPTVKGNCKVGISLAHPHGAHAGILASHHFSIGPGTSTLKLDLNSTGAALLTSGHGRLQAILTIVLHPPGAPSHTTTAHVTVNRKG